jgi:hypothetical protein
MRFHLSATRACGYSVSRADQAAFRHFDICPAIAVELSRKVLIRKAK